MVSQRETGKLWGLEKGEEPSLRSLIEASHHLKIKNFNILSIATDLPPSRDFLGIPPEVPFTVKGRVIMSLCYPMGPTFISPSCNPIQGTVAQPYHPIY